LQNFLLKQQERMRALKRGGNQRMVSFDLYLPEAEAAMLAKSRLSDVNSYDVVWAFIHQRHTIVTLTANT
jgi:hypothetical protein